WSDWYDEQYPDEENGGDEESYQKVISSGKVVCLPDSPVQNIECKAERFPNTPWEELGQTITCDKNQGLKCVNEDQGGLPCYNYKVRSCCSRASGPPAPSPSSRSPVYKDCAPGWSDWYDEQYPDEENGGDEESYQKVISSGNWTPCTKSIFTKPRCPNHHPQLQAQVRWSDWYDEQYPDEENGGDEESYQKVIASGKVVCLPDSPVQNIECKAERFPNTPWQELGQTITCDKNKGLKC
uniref:WxxW domain-containing protein n=1 Tax=Petromyzon marinus TaxID=7757 RepID=S4RWY2_PETMA